MEVLIVYIDFMRGGEGRYYEGIASISAVLKKHKHKVEMLHMVKKFTIAQFLQVFSDRYSEITLVAFSANYHTFGYVTLYASALKRTYPHIFIVCGGVFPSLYPERAISHESMDAICIGEGEYSMLELCNMLDSGGDIYSIRNLWVRKSKIIIKNYLRPLLDDLSSLPMPDRSIFDYSSSIDRRMRRLSFLSSRGCIFNCSYCCNHLMKEKYAGGRYLRCKLPEQLIEEIKYYLGYYGNYDIKCICFQDDIFGANVAWLRKFLDIYKKNINLPYICNSRFDLINNDVILLMRDAGCEEIRFGLESGNDFIRYKVLNKNVDRKTIFEAIRLCRSNGIKVYLYNMIGIPYEDLAKVIDTMKLNAHINPAHYQLTICYPYPNTDLYNFCIASGGKVRNDAGDSLFERKSIVEMEEFPEGDIYFAFDNFRIFVRLYVMIFKIPFSFGRRIMERIVDLMWIKKVGFTDMIYYWNKLVSLFGRRIIRIDK